MANVHVMAVVSIFLPVLMVVAILVRMIIFSMKDEFDDRDTFDRDEIKVV